MEPAAFMVLNYGETHRKLLTVVNVTMTVITITFYDYNSRKWSHVAALV